MNAQHVKGLKIMSLKLGRKIATADDILYDASEQRVKAITVGNTTDSDVRLIHFADIKDIGVDAVMVESEAAIKNLSEVGKPMERMVKDKLYLTNTMVITEDGVELGKIADFSFDPKTGVVTEIEITQGPIKDMKEGRKKVAGSDIVRIGKGTTIVKDYIDEKLASQKAGGLQGILRGVEEKISDTAKNVSLPNLKK